MNCLELRDDLPQILHKFRNPKIDHQPTRPRASKFLFYFCVKCSYFFFGFYQTKHADLESHLTIVRFVTFVFFGFLRHLTFLVALSKNSKIISSRDEDFFSLGTITKTRERPTTDTESKKNMPRRTEAERLAADASNFLTGPTRARATTVAARSDRRERRAVTMAANQINRSNTPRGWAIRGNWARLQDMLAGRRHQANLTLNTQALVRSFLIRMRPELRQGKRFLIRNGESVYTLTLEKAADLEAWLAKSLLTGERVRDEHDASAWSDEELKQADFGFFTSMTIERMRERVSRAYTFAMGAYFGHLHTFDCPDLTATLANLGCWKTVEASNYDDNCLLLAFRSAGVEEPILNAMKTQFLRRTISRKNIEVIAETHGLYVTIQTDQDKRKAFGPVNGFPVSLALFNEHYIHLYDTKYNSYAVSNYDSINTTKSWWTWKSATKRSSKSENRGMNSLQLLKSIIETDHTKPIDITTDNVFQTQFYNKVSEQEFSSLEYPEKYSQLYHPPRDGTGAFKQMQLGEKDNGDIAEDDEEEGDADEEKLKRKIMRSRVAIAGIDPTILTRLDKKFAKLKFGLEEQAKLLSKSIPAKADIFFDFESTTQQSSDAQTTINQCAHKIMTMHNGQETIKAIEAKVLDGNLDLADRAVLYQERCPHVGYMCCWSDTKEGNEKPIVHAHKGPACAREFLDELCERYGEERGPDSKKKGWKVPVVNLYAHNITYDLSFLWQHLARIKTIGQGTSVICGSSTYYRFGKDRATDPRARKRNHPDRPAWCLDKQVEFRFRDTHTMIPMPLRDFGKAFKLEQVKEVMPYNLYTEEFIQRGGIASYDELKTIPGFKDHKQLMENLTKWGCKVGDDAYDMIKYSEIYCQADVLVMMKGYQCFRESFLEFADIDCAIYPTLPSMADAYMTEQGCYEGVHKIAGVPQRFISNASVGGRVMCADNKRVRLRGKGAKQQADFDGVSLYPSAMARILGFLRGSPKVWHVGVDLSKVDGYFLKIRVTGVGKKWRFPICRIRTEEGINHWTNDLEGKTLTVDRFTLEDLVKHSHITYEIIQGYYFDEGRNKRVNEVIKHLFNMRKQYQKEGNPLQLIIKLVMNAAYGICGLKPIETDIKYVNEGDDCTDFWQLHCNRIKVATRMNNRQWRFELYKEIDTHFNRQHVACEILSVSKNIMNEVMCLAEDIDAKIQYTDTDSMHIDNDMVTTLDDAFRVKYGRKLIGEELGQFHTDFDFKTSYHVVDGKLERVGSSMKSVGEITAVESISDEREKRVLLALLV